MVYDFLVPLCPGSGYGSGMQVPWRVLILLLIGFDCVAQEASRLQTMNLTVDGIPRTALVYVPPDAGGDKKLPVVFVYHGHGGNAQAAAKGFKIDQLWPEAISVYPQGINTPGLLHDPEGKQTGWQSMPGTVGDRDLHFFDAMVAQLEKDHPVDPMRIYCTGHSNGAIHTYLLWLSRPNVIAAVAPCSGFAKFGSQLPPKPAMILGGSKDDNVKFEWQQMMIDTVIKVNGCDPAGTPWEGKGTLYASHGGTPLVTFVYPGGHGMVPEEAPLIVKFFQEH